MTFARPGSRPSPPRLQRAVAAVLAIGLGAVGLSGTVRAHGVSGAGFESPLPLWLLLVGAGATVALTAAWLALAETTPVPRTATRRLLTVSASTWSRLRFSMALLFGGVVVAATVAGLVGRQAPNENLATVFTWGVWIHGLAIVAIIVGNPWPAISPWRLAARGLAALEGRELAVLESPSVAAGAWPALVGYLAIVGVVENLTVVPRSPRSTSVVVAAYALAMLAGSLLFGREWFRRADPLESLYGLLGRVSPFTTSSSGETVAVSVRLPWQGTLRPITDGWLVAFVVAMVYTVSFDGFVETATFQSILFGVRELFGSGPETSLLLYLAGFAGFVATFAGACRWCERLGSGRGDFRAAAARFAPTVIPIAAAYEIAHSYPFVVRSAAGSVTAIAHWTGSVGEPVEPLWWLSAQLFWASQLALIVFGHVVAVVAAHHVAVDRYGSDAEVGHLPMVALMVGYTVLSLWIVSRPVIS